MKNIQDFKTFINSLNESINFEKDEIVTLKHPTWKQEYDFKVMTEPGEKPILKQIDGPREIVLDHPEDFRIKRSSDPEPEKIKSEKKKKLNQDSSLIMSEKEYVNLCKSFVQSGLDDRGGESYDFSELNDMAEGQVKYDSKLKNYLIKKLKSELGYKPSIGECIEQMVTDMSRYQ